MSKKNRKTLRRQRAWAQDILHELIQSMIEEEMLLDDDSPLPCTCCGVADDRECLCSEGRCPSTRCYFKDYCMQCGVEIMPNSTTALHDGWLCWNCYEERVFPPIVPSTS